MMKEALVSICSLLNKHGVEYLVIGGVAVIFHAIQELQQTLIFGINLAWTTSIKS